MNYEQLPDGRWHQKPEGQEYKPQPVACWYMRDNHTLVKLPLDVNTALSILRQERDAGQTYGMLCGHPIGVVPKPIHAGTTAEWATFEEAAKQWLETAIARSRPPEPVRVGPTDPVGSPQAV